MMNFKNKYLKYIIYTILFILIAGIIFLPFVINGRSFIWFDDGAKQHYIIFYDYMLWLKEIISSGMVSSFSWNVGLGGDILVQYAYYIIGDIFSYIGLLFPCSLYPYVYSGLIVLRMFFVGISMFVYCNYKKVDDYKSLLCAILYTFSAFVLFSAVRHPYFTNAAILFPLFIVGIEKLIKENKKIFLTIISFFVIMSNFYFCYKIVILGMIYAVFLFIFDNPSKTIINFFKKLFTAGICFLVAFFTSGFILIPTIYTFLNLNTATRNSLSGFYPITYYSNLVVSYVSTNVSFWTVIGVSVLCIMLIPLLLKNLKKSNNRVLFCCLAITTLMLLFPLFGSIMNGFSFPSNRWVFGYIFFIVLIVVQCLNENLIYNKKELFMMSGIVLFYFILLFIGLNMSFEFIIQSSIAILFLLLFIFQYKFKTKIVAKIALLLIVCFGYMFNGLFLYSNYGKGYANEFIKYDNIDNFYYNLNGSLKNMDKVVPEIGNIDKDFYRIARIPDTYHNLSILLNYKSTAGYFSLYNGTTSILSNDLNNLQNKASNSIKLFDNRTIVNNVLGNKYYMVTEENINKLPYGYEKVLDFDFTDVMVYENKYNLSPFVFYDSYIMNDVYNDLSSLEKENSLLHTAAVSDGVLKGNVEKNNLEIDDISKLECNIVGVKKEKDNYIYNFSNDEIELNCSGVEVSEVYLEIKNLDMFESASGNYSYWVKVNREDYFNSKKIENKLTSAYYSDLPIMLFNMGYVSSSDEVNINIKLTSDGKYSIDDINVYAVSMEQYEKNVSKLNNSRFNVEDHSDGYISGKIDVEKDGILQFAVDYSKGWRVLVDGNEVETFIVNNAFLGIELSKGEHEIVYIYDTPYEKISLISTFLGIIGFCGIIIFECRGVIEMKEKFFVVKNFIKRILQKVRRQGYVLFYLYFKLTTKVVDNKVLFLSDSREDLSGNFEFVYNELMKDKGKYDINMLLKKSLTTKKSLKEKIYLCKEIALSKYIFLDDFYPIIYVLKLRKETKLIQLWHAMGAFKTVGYSRMGKPGGPTGKSLTHRGYTGAIVSSESIRKNYAEAFNMDINKVDALGIPRTDIFFDKKYEENIKKKLYSKYPVLKKKKVILFAPTFRGNGQKTAYYDFDWIDFKKFKESFGNDYVCIIKLHPFIKNVPDYDFANDKFYLDLTSEREINDLLFITDVLVTDYSSVIFEYSFFERPVVFFVPDLDDYCDSRDFYYPLEKYTYGDVVKNDDDLIKAIKKNRVDKKKIKEFKKYFCSSCDGKSSKKVVDYYIRKGK